VGIWGRLGGGGEELLVLFRLGWVGVGLLVAFLFWGGGGCGGGLGLAGLGGVGGGSLCEVGGG